MKAIWNGAIAFGLVNIPVKLYSAIEASELDLDMVDKKDHSKIRYKRVNEKTGKEVPWNNITKAYNLNGNYIVLSDEDFEKASPEKSKTIDIQEFVDISTIDSVYFDTPYYVQPAKGGEKAYVLLRDALKKSKKAGIATFVLRSKENLALLRFNGNILIIQKMRYADEIRDTKLIDVPKLTSKPAELKMAVSLINQLSDKFDITKYKDSYTNELMKLIKAKSKGKTVKQPAMRVVHSNKEDLMEQLKASLGSRKKKAS